eukprot:1186555-Prorocentrum_minimum.AAC.4
MEMQVCTPKDPAGRSRCRITRQLTTTRLHEASCWPALPLGQVQAYSRIESRVERSSNWPTLGTSGKCSRTLSNRIHDINIETFLFSTIL